MNEARARIVQEEWKACQNKDITLEQFIRNRSGLFRMADMLSLKDVFLNLYSQARIDKVPLDLKENLISIKKNHHDSLIINTWNQFGSPNMTIGEFNSTNLRRQYTNDRVREVLKLAYQQSRVSLKPNDISFSDSFYSREIRRHFKKRAIKTVRRNNVGQKILGIIGVLSFDITVITFNPELLRSFPILVFGALGNIAAIVLLWWSFSPD